MPDSPDPVERQLRDHLGRTQQVGFPPDLLERVDRIVQTTPQVRPAPEWMRRAAPVIAAVLIVAILVTGGPFLYGTLVGPGPTMPTAAPSPTGASSTIPPTAPPTALPTARPTPTLPSTPRPTPVGSPTTSFDLRGTAWHLVELPGHPLTPETTPTLDFGLSARGAPAGIGGVVFNGCSSFTVNDGFYPDGSVPGGLYPGQQDPVCPDLTVRDAFLARLTDVSAWVVVGDFLVLSGPAGTLEFLRDLPPPGDPGRALADALRTGTWIITSATGVSALDLYPPVAFGDRRWFGGPGTCGFGGQLSFQVGGRLDIENAGFDTTFCADANQRNVLVGLLEQATVGTLESRDRVRLAGPAGDVMLTRLSAAFPGRTSTLRFTAENGTRVTIALRDGSGLLTGAAQADPLPVYEPSDLDINIANTGNKAVLHVEWLASGGCLPNYNLTIEPGARRILVEQLTPPGFDSVGGECRVRLTFSRPVTARDVVGLLLYPR
jgi:hypothetical protein